MEHPPPLASQPKSEVLEGPPKKKRRLVSAVIDEKGYRLRSGCFPIRQNPETSSCETMLITSRSDHERWCIPMGPIDPGEIAAEAATRGTREEAGVIGRLRDPERPLGVWPNMERRSKTSIFVLDVTQELIDKWEGSDRARKWFSIQEAEEVLQWKPLNITMLNSLKERLGLLRRQEDRRLDNLLAGGIGSRGASGEEEEEADGGVAHQVLKTNGFLAQSPEVTPTATGAAVASAPMRSLRAGPDGDGEDPIGDGRDTDEEEHFRLLQDGEALGEKEGGGDSVGITDQPAVVYLRAGSESSPAVVAGRHPEDADLQRASEHGDPTSYP